MFHTRPSLLYRLTEVVIRISHSLLLLFLLVLLFLLFLLFPSPSSFPPPGGWSGQSRNFLKLLHPYRKKSFLVTVHTKNKTTNFTVKNPSTAYTHAHARPVHDVQQLAVSPCGKPCNEVMITHHHCRRLPLPSASSSQLRLRGCDCRLGGGRRVGNLLCSERPGGQLQASCLVHPLP